MPEIFTIPAEEMPTKTASVSFREPTFFDRREASRRYPTATRVGYAAEELLAAMCLTAFNGVPLPESPRDPIEYLKEMGHIDGQYFMSTFLALFTLDEDMAKQAKEVGLKMKTSSDASHSVPSGFLPCEGISFSFHAPTLGDRMALDKAYPGADSNCGYSLEEMMFCDCLDTINGEPVTKRREIISLIDEWTHLDAQFALGIFINAVTIDKNDDNRAKSLGKSLRANSKAQSKKSTKTSTTKTSKVDTTIPV